jgi:RNA polymerase sigma-70 factor (ECF subfamily)
MSIEESRRLFVRLLTQHQRRVYGYILKLIVNWNDADEILQETNLRLWEEFDRFEPGTDFAAWAIRVAHYQILTWRKKRNRSRLVFDEAAIQTIHVEEQSIMAAGDSREQALMVCLEQLTARNRDLIQRCYAGKHTIRRVAEELNRSAVSVYKSVQRIRLSLHRCIERRLALEEA